MYSILTKNNALQLANYECADQTVRTRILVSAFVVHIKVIQNSLENVQMSSLVAPEHVLSDAVLFQASKGGIKKLKVAAEREKTWLPNRFVPLVDVPRTAEYQPTSSEVNVHIPIVVDTHSHPKTFQSPNRFSIFMEEETGNNNSNEVGDKENVLSIEVGDSSTKVEDNKETVLSDPVSIEVGDSSTKIEDTENELPNPFGTTIPKSTETCDLSTKIEETEYDHDDQTNEYVSEVQTMEFRQLDEDTQSGEDDVSDEEIEITFKPGPLDNKYMGIKDTIQLLQSPFTTIEEIPRGRKDGMYFLLDNSSNIESHDWRFKG